MDKKKIVMIMKLAVIIIICLVAILSCSKEICPAFMNPRERAKHEKAKYYRAGNTYKKGISSIPSPYIRGN